MEHDPRHDAPVVGVDGSPASNAQRWRALRIRRRRVEQVIESLLSDIRRRAEGVGPQPWTVGPTHLELARLEAAQRLRESIEREMQALTEPITE